MPSYTRTVVTTTRIEYRVPAPHRGGGGIAYWGDLRQAMQEIEADLGPKQASYDDAVQIEAGENEIILSYEVT